MDNGISIVIAKRGSSGFYVFNNNKECDIDAFEYDIVDDAGAGDYMHI